MVKTKSEQKLKNKGVSSVIGTGLILVILLIATSIFISSIKEYHRTISSAKDDQGKNIRNTVQTDIKIENIHYSPEGENLRITTKNTGSTTLDVSDVDYLLNGQLIPEENIAKQKVEKKKKEVWPPKENLETVILHVKETPSRGKQIASYGISDYFSKEEVKVI